MFFLYSLFTSPRHLRLIWVPLIGILALGFFASSAFATSTVRWYRFESCDPAPSSFASQQSPERIACGGLGTYYVGDETLSYSSSCSHSVYGVEAPALYLSQHNPQFSPSAGEWFPCSQGTCLGRQGRPWAALIDWNQGHGWSVAGTLAQASGQGIDLELFPLDEGGSTLDPAGASDLDVLAQLCAIAEAAEAQPTDLPLVVNLSFGRIYDADAGSQAQSRGQMALQDQIEAVLRHLDFDLDLQLVAAAGNHGELLFPASDPHVMAVGAIDIEHYAQSTLVSSAPRTPSQALALMPGYGLYLQHGVGAGLWSVPPGSSYASALASGWLAGLMANQSLTRSTLGLSASSSLEPVAAGGDYLLVLDGQTLAGSASPGATELIAGALEHASAACGSSPPSPIPVTALPVTPTLPTESSAQISARESLPLPNTRPCVPCHGLVTISGLTIELEDSEGFPSEYELDNLYLRVGSTYYEVTDPSTISAFKAGQIDQLLFSGVGPIPVGTEVEMVYVLNLPLTAPFWDATPVHMHN